MPQRAVVVRQPVTDDERSKRAEAAARGVVLPHGLVKREQGDGKLVVTARDRKACAL